MQRSSAEKHYGAHADLARDTVCEPRLAWRRLARVVYGWTDRRRAERRVPSVLLWSPQWDRTTQRAAVSTVCEEVLA